MNKNTVEIVKIVTKEYKQKSYKELQPIIDYKHPNNFFYRKYKNKSYWFEIMAEYYNGKNIRVHVGGEPPGFFGWCRGFACYFGKKPNGELVEDYEADIVF